MAFVSGGGTGIGLACAKAIHARGGSVVLAGRARIVRDAAAALGERAAGVRCDVTDDASVEAAIKATVERFGGLHLAVNSAGIGAVGSVLNGTSADFTRTLDTNLTGVFRCLRAEAAAMTDGGSIVNISSIAGALTHRWMSAYCASKAGVNMLTMCAADDLGEHNIRVNAVMPGLVYTDLAQGAHRQRDRSRRVPASDADVAPRAAGGHRGDGRVPAERRGVVDHGPMPRRGRRPHDAQGAGPRAVVQPVPARKALARRRSSPRLVCLEAGWQFDDRVRRRELAVVNLVAHGCGRHRERLAGCAAIGKEQHAVVADACGRLFAGLRDA